MNLLKSPVIQLVYIIIVALKLDGILDAPWLLIFCPILVHLGVKILVSILGAIYVFIVNLKGNQKFNTRYDGARLYWDAATKRMYTPFKTETVENEEGD